MPENMEAYSAPYNYEDYSDEDEKFYDLDEDIVEDMPPDEPELFDEKPRLSHMSSKTVLQIQEPKATTILEQLGEAESLADSNLDSLTEEVFKIKKATDHSTLRRKYPNLVGASDTYGAADLRSMFQKP
jgi:hypothetical protein